MLDAFSEKSMFEQTLSGGGKLVFNQAAYKNKVNFLDYIMGGCEIQVHVAIDFTMSNKPPVDPTSLHYLSPVTMRNQYTDAINSVVSILENYDSDNLYPVFGFGAKLPGGRNTQD